MSDIPERFRSNSVEGVPTKLQLEIKEYGAVSSDLIGLARIGISEVLKEVDVAQTKPLTLHITEGVFQNQHGTTFTEIYERLPEGGNMFIAYDEGFRPKYRQQLERRYGFPADSPPKTIFLYSACHSAVHYTQDLRGEPIDIHHTDAARFNPDSTEYIQEHLDDPLEQEAHKIGLAVSQRIKIDTPSIQVVTKNPEI